MKKRGKKKHEKPRMTDIKLDANSALLTSHKTDSSFGPGWVDCNPRAYYSSQESVITPKNHKKSTR